MKFMANGHVIPYGKLLLSDILQYDTVADAAKITGEKGLVYKTFFAKEPGANGKMNKITFDANLPDEMTEEDKLEMSYELLMKQGGLKSNLVLYKANPSLIRSYKYKFTIDADVLNPRSAELERAFDLETYDRAINNPVADQERLYKDLLMSSNPKTARNPGDYVIKEQPAPAMGPDGLPMAGQQQQGGSIAKPNAPISGGAGAPQGVAK